MTTSVLLTCTLLGKLALHVVSYDDNTRSRLDTKWTGEVVELQKVNAIAATNNWLAVGGFSEGGAGLVEVWKITEHEHLVESMSTLSVS